MSKTYRTTISIPRDLKEEMDALGDQVNWSAVAAAAFRAKVFEVQNRRRESMSKEDVIKRMRTADENDTEGSRRLIQAAAEMGAAEQRGRELPPEQVERRRRTAREKNLAQYLQPGYHGPRWTQEQPQLLGAEPDVVVAEKVGRTAQAVRVMRSRLGIPNPAARPGAYGSPPWTAAEDRLVRTLPPAQAAARTGRTMDAVYRRRHHLGLTGHRRTVAKSRRR